MSAWRKFDRAVEIVATAAESELGFHLIALALGSIAITGMILAYASQTMP